MTPLFPEKLRLTPFWPMLALALLCMIPAGPRLSSVARCLVVHCSLDPGMSFPMMMMMMMTPMETEEVWESECRLLMTLWPQRLMCRQRRLRRLCPMSIGEHQQALCRRLQQQLSPVRLPFGREASRGHKSKPCLVQVRLPRMSTIIASSSRMEWVSAWLKKDVAASNISFWKHATTSDACEEMRRACQAQKSVVCKYIASAWTSEAHERCLLLAAPASRTKEASELEVATRLLGSSCTWWRESPLAAEAPPVQLIRSWSDAKA